MTDEIGIVELLARCEAAVGIELAQIRGNLSSNEWLSGIWELMILDAALALGSVKYEHAAPGGVAAPTYYSILTRAPVYGSRRHSCGQKKATVLRKSMISRYSVF
jgi:hypothetical protein